METKQEAVNGKPLVSVTFLTYNQEKYITEALQGLLSQTYSNMDIIITDDASSDATPEIIAAELSKQPTRSDIRFIRNAHNLGDYGRGNFLKALALSRGKFIIISCGDDVMLPNLVEDMVRIWRRDRVSLVTANATYIDENSRDLNRFRRRPQEGYDDSFETLARNGSNETCFGAAMGFERSLYEEFGWPPAYLTCSDIMLPFYAYLAKGARFIPEPLLKYRVHPQNSSLSLKAETGTKAEILIAEEYMHYVELAHAFFMEAELDRLSENDPSRFSQIAQTIKPLIHANIVDRARMLTHKRTALAEFEITRLHSLVPQKEG